MKEQYELTQKADGIKFNWNVFPSTRLEASQLSSPIGCLYTPLHKRPHQLQPIPLIDLKGPPISCDTCGNHINPYIKIDRANKMWYCPYCDEKNFIPSSIDIPLPDAPIEAWPEELRPSSTTVEYVLPQDAQMVKPSRYYVFVIDTYQHIDEVRESQDSSFEGLKTSICDAIEMLPDGVDVSVVTYDEYVFVHKPELETFVALTTHDIFPVDKETNTIVHKDVKFFDGKTHNKILSKLESGKGTTQPDAFFVNLTSTSKKALVKYISSLKPKLTDSYKPPRATGFAAYVISTMLAKFGPRGLVGKVLLFTSGPCTIYPGNIINMTKGGPKTLRSHKDINNLTVPEFIQASKFYKTLALIGSGLSFEDANTIITRPSKKETDFPVGVDAPKWSFDLISGSLDQVGTYEMKSLASHTLGSIYIYDSFCSQKFERDLKANIQTDLSSKYLSTLTVKTSAKLKVSRMIGHGHNLPSSYQTEKFFDTHHQKISDHVTQFDSSSKKNNYTNQWYFHKLSSGDTFVILFEPEVVRSSNDLQMDGIQKSYIQFQLKYWDFDSMCWKLRVTNIEKYTTLFYLAANRVKMSNNTYKLVNTTSSIVKEQELLGSFDQDAFIVVLTRSLLDKIDTTLGYEHFDNISSDIDKILVKLLYNWGGISVSKSSTNQNPYSNLLEEIVQKYEINENFRRLPSLAYHLRRNPQLIKIFNSSPDETAFYHHWFSKFDCVNAITVIQPKLYEIQQKSVKEVSLDSQNISNAGPGSFLIMDSVFNIVIYKNDESLSLHHSNNQDLVYDKDSSVSEISDFIEDSLTKRPLLPKYVVTQKNHSQARFLVSRLNPLETVEDDFAAVKVEEGFFQKLFRSKSGNKSYNDLLTDEMSLNKYYNGLIESVKRYVIEDDF